MFYLLLFIISRTGPQPDCCRKINVLLKQDFLSLNLPLKVADPTLVMTMRTTIQHSLSGKYIPAVITLLCLLIFCFPSCSALYDFEGIPFKIVATGEVTGDVQTFGTYGLRDPPVALEFDVPSEIQWARTYVGVWGGTPRYTGWVGLAINNGTVAKTDLFGKDDRNPNVYVTGYGVYWVAYDTTTYMRTGHNTVIATTSRTDPNNKLDGRVYAVLTVLVVKDQRGSSTRYWIAEGNENLHGEGWSGTNPTKHDEASVIFPVQDISGISTAKFSVLYLASGKGQPDYTLFNTKDLGSPVTDTKNYPKGAYDIADETSFNAGVQAPVDSRYTDMEIFDIKNLIKSGNNEVVFQRGRDLNGEGEITASGEKPEGEDYLHPVFAMLTLQKPRATASSPDLMIGEVSLKDAFEGETSAITATVQNLGTPAASPATLIFRVDDIEVARQQVPLEKSGIQQVSAPWKASAGYHTLQVEIQITGDPDTTNNIARQEAVIGSLPDLAVSISPPLVAGEPGQQQKSPPGIGIMIGALVVVGMLALRYRRPPKKFPAALRSLPAIGLILLVIAAGGAVLPSPVTASDATRSYTLPVTIKNLGGSDAGSFTVTVYLDGERVVVKNMQEGLSAGKGIIGEIPLHTTPGSHEVRVVIDEEGKVRDASRANNSAGSTYAFP